MGPLDLHIDATIQTGYDPGISNLNLDEKAHAHLRIRDHHSLLDLARFIVVVSWSTVTALKLNYGVKNVTSLPQNPLCGGFR